MDFLAERYGWTPREIADIGVQELRMFLAGAERREGKKERRAKRNANSTGKTDPARPSKRQREQDMMQQFQEG